VWFLSSVVEVSDIGGRIAYARLGFAKSVSARMLGILLRDLGTFFISVENH
jgi:hypothetical protein